MSQSKREEDKPAWQTGSVRWFDPVRRFGFIIPDRGADDVFLYWRELKTSRIPECDLEAGTRVRFTTRKPDRPGSCELQVDRIRLACHNEVHPAEPVRADPRGCHNDLSHRENQLEMAEVLDPDVTNQLKLGFEPAFPSVAGSTRGGR